MAKCKSFFRITENNGVGTYEALPTEGDFEPTDLLTLIIVKDGTKDIYIPIGTETGWEILHTEDGMEFMIFPLEQPLENLVALDKQIILPLEKRDMGTHYANCQYYLQLPRP